MFAFNTKMDDFLNKLIKYPHSKDTRHSTPYFEIENSVIIKTSAIDVFIEPKKRQNAQSFSYILY